VAVILTHRGTTPISIWPFYTGSSHAVVFPQHNKNLPARSIAMPQNYLPAEENHEDADFAPLFHKADWRLERSRKRRLDMRLELFKRRHLAA
jgi:hypothetical protein